MNIPILGDIIDGIIGLGKEVIIDKDKQIEFEYKARELWYAQSTELLKTITLPWVDATVKLLYAFNSLWRPIVSASMTAFAAYCAVAGVELSDTMTTVFASAFPAWGVSRHMNKQKSKE
jgi:hypothetical protein